MPEISVIMGVYNELNKDILMEAVNSILHQTFEDFEFIIYDDGSCPEAATLLREVEGLDERIKLIGQDENHGLAFSLNACIDEAKGKQMLADTIREHYENNQPLDEILHEEAMQEFYHYCIVGGMPAAVKADLAKDSPIEQTEIRQMLLNSYIADMTKYADKSDTIRIFEAYDSLPAQLAKDAKKFQYKLIKSGARASQYGDAIDWLIRAGIVNKCMKCSQGFYPVVAYQDVSAFKLYYSDMGIMSARMGMTLEALRGKETEHFRGILTENYVAIALKTKGYDLHYWESDNTAEVDFLIQKDSHVIPVECKAGNHVKAKSMMVYMEKYDPVYAMRISTRNFGMVNGIKSVPLYSVFCI